MDPGSETRTVIDFGRFRVLPRRREVLAEGQSLELGGRAFDVLMALIDASGAVVSKNALMDRVWPDRIVEQNSLQAQISALRKALAGDRALIRTVAGRGYQFTGVIRTVSLDPDAEATSETTRPKPMPSVPSTNLPEPVSTLIGRDAEMGEILDLSASHRLVTLTGAGGIGKTRLGVEVARHQLPRFTDGVWLAELAPLSDPDLVPVTVAIALGLELTSGTASPQSVANALRSKQLMLVLDNCEHVIDAAARMAEALLSANPAVRVIATSREPLRAEGEWVYLVRSLAVPPENSVDGDDPLSYGAVRLFGERARAAAPTFSPGARAVTAIAGICRRLDGIPLAIELAAARAAALGIDGLAARLDDRFQLLASGRRTALPRHQTLRGTLDWSYELLTERERMGLRRLAIFAGGFTMGAVREVLADDVITATLAVDCVSSLVAKSLVTADVGGAMPRYRLLETTRAYALEKLVDAGEFDAVARRHARRYLGIFECAEAEVETRPTDEWLADYIPRIDNLRAALDWALSPIGDASIGVQLTAAAVPLWMHLSLMEECIGRVERALAATAPRNARREMKLLVALAASLIYTRGAVSEIGEVGTRALEIAERLDDTEYQLRSLWTLYSFSTAIGQPRVTLSLAQRFHALAAKRSDPNDRLLGERFIGTSLYYLGDLLGARRQLERVLARHFAPVRKRRIVPFASGDERLSARIYLARILWLLGMPDRAMQAAQASVADAEATSEAILPGFALVVAACPIALWIGDLAMAEHYVGMLLDHSARHGLARWRAYGRIYQAELGIQRGDIDAGLALLRSGFVEPAAVGFAPRIFMALLASALGRAGQIADGLAAIEEAIVRSERTEERWLLAELLRIKGELSLLQGAPTAAVENHFRRALEVAGEQRALSWELRAATSLARLWRDQGRGKEAHELLAPVYDRFTEGFSTADLRAAKSLIDEIS